MSSSNLQDTALMSNEEYFNFLEISPKKIRSATNHFAYENLIVQGTTFEVYKGQLLLHSGSQLINIVVRKSLQIHIVMNELMLCKYLNHKNISSTFKIGYDDIHTFIINKHETNGSLDKHLGDTTLTWMQRLQICLGVARALSYIHNHALDNEYIIHGNIKSSKILLDDNWEPKLHGFGFSPKVKRSHRYISRKYNGALQYMDPAYDETKTLTYKSDVFSFGVVLFEVLFGRNASIPVSNEDHGYFARLARLHYEEKTLDNMIDLDLREQMDLQSMKIFSETAYFCLKEKRGERPYMDQVVKRLETALELQHKYQTPEHSRTATVGGTLSDHLKGKNLDHLKIRLSDIEFATNEFSSSNVIGQGGYGVVYKAELDHFDSINSSATAGNNKVEYSKRHSTVAIKRLFSRQDGQVEEGFFAEIEMHTNCKHPNVVSLLGFCEEGLERILVYEHVSNGSLNDYLGNIKNITNLTWVQRIQISLDIAHGMNYLHYTTEEKQMIIHRDIKSDNILLDDNWVAKIADFGLSKLRPADLKASTINTVNIAGTTVYLDPEYMKTGKLKKESDIYSFGVVLFEILCGRVAYDEIYDANDDNGLPSTIRRCFKEGTWKELVDPKLKEADENIFILNGGLNQDSLDTFFTIAFQCLANTQVERPKMKVVIEQLEKALHFQKNNKDNLQISRMDIKLLTRNLGEGRCFGEGRYWKQYEGEIPHANGNFCTTVVAKRFDSTIAQGNLQFIRELNVLLEYKHENIVSLVRYCNELDDKIIVYEHAINGSLDKHLDNSCFTWMKRVKICIDVARGLAFLRTKSMIHRDIKSASIVIDGDWKAKISNLELTENYGEFGEIEHVAGSLSYVDPMFKMQGYLTEWSDIYSLGVVLLEMLSGRLVCVCKESLADLVLICKWSKKAFDELVFEDIKQHSAPDSLTTFFKIVSGCLELVDCNRPDADEVVIQLMREDYEIWVPKLPTDYKEIILMSNNPDIYLNRSKKDLYEMLTTTGILLQQGKLMFVLGGNGERNEIISATKFSYKYRSMLRWQLFPESRFPKVAEILDITNLKIQVKIKTQLLSPGINYAVHLVFKFHRPRKYTAKWIYVNLKYKMWSNYLHAYFARRREDGWMTIELCRFLNHKKNTDFEVQLESFSRCYCERRFNCVYVEGIEFRAIDNIKYEEMENLNDVESEMKSSSNLDVVRVAGLEMFRSFVCLVRKIKMVPPSNWTWVSLYFFLPLFLLGFKKILLFLYIIYGSSKNKCPPCGFAPYEEQPSPMDSQEILERFGNDEQLFLLNQVNGKKRLMLSAIGVLYDSSKVKPFNLKFSADSRFQVVVELLPNT